MGLSTPPAISGVEVLPDSISMPKSHKQEFLSFNHTDKGVKNCKHFFFYKFLNEEV